jgi:predicted transcriptional regulator
MEVQLNPDLQGKLDNLAARRQLSSSQIVEEVMAVYLGGVESFRQTLDSRYDEVVSGQVKLLDGEEVFGEILSEHFVPTKPHG